MTVHSFLGPRWVRLREAELECANDYDERLSAALTRLLRTVKHDVSVAELIRRSRLDARRRELVLSFLQNFLAVPVEAMSASWLAEVGAEPPGPVKRLTGGYGPLAAHLAREAEPCLRLGSRVSRVDWKTESVRIGLESITGQSDVVSGRAVLVTLPVGVLTAPEGAEGSIVFSPPLGTTHRRALGQLVMGHVVKVVLRFREAFWRSKKYERAAFFQDATSPFPTFWTALPSDAPMVTAWAGGPSAEHLRGMDARALAKIAVDAFARLLGFDERKAHGLLEAVFVHDWSSDPFTRGAYAHPLVGSSRNVERRQTVPSEACVS